MLQKHRTYINRIGQKFGKLSVVGYSHHNEKGESHWTCLCDCGVLAVKRGTNLGRRTNSCGLCCRRDK